MWHASGAGEPHHMDGSITATAAGGSSAVAVLNPVKLSVRALVTFLG